MEDVGTMQEQAQTAVGKARAKRGADALNVGDERGNRGSGIGVFDGDRCQSRAALGKHRVGREEVLVALVIWGKIDGRAGAVDVEDGGRPPDACVMAAPLASVITPMPLAVTVNWPVPRVEVPSTTLPLFARETAPLSVAGMVTENSPMTLPAFIIVMLLVAPVTANVSSLSPVIAADCVILPPAVKTAVSLVSLRSMAADCVMLPVVAVKDAMPETVMATVSVMLPPR